MLKAEEKRKLRGLLAGVLDGIAEQPETVAACAAWDAQLGVSAKAKRLALADQRLCQVRKGRAKAQEIAAAHRARDEALVTFEAATAGRDLWDAQIARAADQLIRKDLCFRLEDPLRASLAWALEYHFVVEAAARGGWPIPAGDEPDFSPPIGQRFQFTIPEYWPVSYVRRCLSPPRGKGIRPAATLPDFVARVRAAITAVERRDAKAGKPASRYADAVRRDGRQLFLVESRRSTVEQLASARHQAQGKGHAYQQGPGFCDHCRRGIQRQLAGARRLIAQAIKHYR